MPFTGNARSRRDGDRRSVEAVVIRVVPPQADVTGSVGVTDEMLVGVAVGARL
jgi:hypothetical protein